MILTNVMSAALLSRQSAYQSLMVKLNWQRSGGESEEAEGEVKLVRGWAAVRLDREEEQAGRILLNAGGPGGMTADYSVFQKSEISQHVLENNCVL